MAHTHSLTHAHTHTHTHTETHTRKAAETESCVKSRISWRLFIMHNVPPTVECGRVEIIDSICRHVCIGMCVCVRV